MAGAPSLSRRPAALLARAGLTIAGFYYVCLERASGRIEGFYFDPSSTPFQRLDLQASCPGAAPRCQSFGTFEYR